MIGDWPDTGTKPVGRALAVTCPVCESEPEENCCVAPGAGMNERHPHVERGRLARWTEMFKL